MTLAENKILIFTWQAAAASSLVQGYPGKVCFLVLKNCYYNFSRYLSLWLMSEGVCALSGLSYTPPPPQVFQTKLLLRLKFLYCRLITLPLQENGATPAGKADWKGCANVRLRTLESATWFHHYVAAFNINTNQWCMNYIFKRLKFLNNRMVRKNPKYAW